MYNIQYPARKKAILDKYLNLVTKSTDKKENEWGVTLQ